jgi:endonuclease YncB( thermonuclease family)
VRQDALPFEPCPSAHRGLLVNAAVRSPLTGHSAALAVPAFSAARGGQPAALGSARPSGLDPRFGYSAEVVHVIDGDTFEARVAVWPGIEIKTRVRLRGIDAPKLHARCDHEWVRRKRRGGALDSGGRRGSWC